MNSIAHLQALDVENLLTQVGGELGKSATEDRKVAAARVRVTGDRIQDKRQERISQLQEQITASPQAGACLQFLGAVFKVFDLLTKPLTAITGGLLKVELGKVLEQLQNSKFQSRLLGLKIDREQLQSALQGLKGLFEDDRARLDAQADAHSQDYRQILRMLEDIHRSFSNLPQS